MPNVFVQIAFYRLFGHPLVMYGGLLTGSFFAAAAIVGAFGVRLKIKNQHKVHVTLACTALLLALLHLIIAVGATW